MSNACNATFRLKPGDKVALVAPASGQKSGQDSLVAEAVDLLENWGLMVVQTPKFAPQCYLAADDASRAASLVTALTAPEISAIFITRGGYGCARLLPFLHDIRIPSPRFLVGFSDVTTLHLHFAGQPNLHRVHGVNVATTQCLAPLPAAQANQQALNGLLFNRQCPSFSCYPLADKLNNLDETPFMLSHTQKTAWVGGCLSLLVTSLGTAHEIDTAHKVLMIEEVGESPYRIDRMLTHLKNAGKFEQTSAIVLGDFVSCDSTNISIESVLLDCFAGLTCPVYRTPQFGHGETNLPWLF